MSGKVIPMRRRLKGGTVSVLMRPGYHVVVHVDGQFRTTELERLTEYEAAAQRARQLAFKFKATFAPLMFG